MTANELRRQKAYQERVGKIYGCWKVIKVEYKKGADKDQVWTVECIHCGKVKTISYCKKLISGKVGRSCECQFVPKPKPLTQKEKYKLCEGQIIDDWKIIRYDEGQGFLCECVKCGRIAYKQMKPLLEHRAPKCTCSVNQRKYDEVWIGRKFGHLTVVNVYTKKCNDNKKRSYFTCVCDCGNTCEILPVRLVGFKQKCCSPKCEFNNEDHKLDYGSVKHTLYRKLQNMKARCNNPNTESYKMYGAKGIRVCDEWANGREGFYNFFKWSMEHGWKEGLTIDRINPDGNYEPNNCRYITREENSSLARHNLTPSYKRKTKYSAVQVCINEDVCDLKTALILTGISYERIMYYVQKKSMTWQEAFDYALSKPKRKHERTGKYSKKQVVFIKNSAQKF